MEELHLAIYYAIPFVVLLLGIALLPLFSAHLWERYYWLYGLLCSLSFIIPFAAQYGALQVVYELVHSLLLDYVPFITLIFALYVTAGGIVVEGTLSGTPLTNTLLLLVAAPLASLIGTTGASMLLVRPLIRSISHRVYQRHTVVFFIFVASNVAGSMTPIGDPPVYLGFLKGVDFFWPLLNVWEPTLVVIGALLVMYYVYDLHLYRREQKLGLAHHHHHDEEVALEPKDDHEEKTVVDIVVETDGVKDMQRVDTEATVVGDIEFIASNEDSREASSNSMGVSRSETSGHVAKFLTPPSHAESGSPAQLKDDATKSSIVPLGLYPLRQDDEVSPSLRSKPSFTGSVGSRPSLNARQSGSRPVSQNASIKSVASSIMHEVVAAVMGEDEENEEGGVDSDAWSVVESLKPPKRWALPVWIEGWANVVLTTGVVVVVVISGYLKKAFGEYGFTVMRNPHNDAEEIFMPWVDLARILVHVQIGVVSYLTTPKRLHELNKYTWSPFLEVAFLFVHIFFCLIPILLMFALQESGALGFIVSGVREVWHFFWIAGALSGFLDNAPTYLLFFNVAGGDALVLTTEKARILEAITCGAVFFGGLSYIGNAPNMLVRNIAVESGVKMPSFVGYLVWACGVLLPVFAVVTAIFFRP